MKKIISTYHHSFAGGSKNTSRLLHFLSTTGVDVEAYFYETPQYFIYTKTNSKIHTIPFNNIHSDVIDQDTLKNYSIADQIISSLNGTKDTVLFGANLFPYCNILHDVKSQLNQLKEYEPKLILHPVGSDIWQIGTRMKSRVKWLLDSPFVNCILTYSSDFIEDIKEYYGIKNDIQVLYPILEQERFFPINEGEISKRRISLGFKDDDFIIHHHSSMRKIKCPEVTLDLAIKTSQMISQKCVLIMTGPVPKSVISNLNFNLIDIAENDTIFKYRTDISNLTIYWTGVLSSVEYLLQMSDVEVNTSLYDSFNLSLMEAMACGVPVLTSDVVGVKQHINKAVAGFCFPTKKLPFDELNELLENGNSRSVHFDIDFAVSALTEIANNRDKAKKMGAVGATYCIENFNSHLIAERFNKIVNEC